MVQQHASAHFKFDLTFVMGTFLPVSPASLHPYIYENIQDYYMIQSTIITCLAWKSLAFSYPGKGCWQYWVGHFYLVYMSRFFLAILIKNNASSFFLKSLDQTINCLSGDQEELEKGNLIHPHDFPPPPISPELSIGYFQNERKLISGYLPTVIQTTHSCFARDDACRQTTRNIYIVLQRR